MQRARLDTAKHFTGIIRLLSGTAAAYTSPSTGSSNILPLVKGREGKSRVKICHLAALTLVGWYLMVSPLMPD
jgi:hypothetical protein